MLPLQSVSSITRTMVVAGFIGCDSFEPWTRNLETVNAVPSESHCRDLCIPYKYNSSSKVSIVQTAEGPEGYAACDESTVGEGSGARDEASLSPA
jgi:hypothetical protein